MSQVEVRTYRATSQAKAAEQLALDARRLSGQGLEPTQQIWSGRQFWPVLLIVLVLVVFGAVMFGIEGAGIGAIIGILFVLVVRPKGTLTVTYTRRVP